MKILFLTYHGFDPTSGITKKMFAQVKGLRECGHDVRMCYYDFDPSTGHRCRYVDDRVIRDYGQGRLAAIRQRLSLRHIADYCRDEGIGLVYARHFMNAAPPVVSLFRRLRRQGVVSVIEIPTFPYDAEFRGFPFSLRMKLHVDQLFRRAMARQATAIVTFSDEAEIFGQRTIRISNGVDLDAIPLHQNPSLLPGHTLHLIAVAEVHVWHGYDRLLRGLGEYWRTKGDDERPVVLHIVGGVAAPEMEGTDFIPGFRPILDEYQLGPDRVVFHGMLFGEQLDSVFRQCHFAIGSLGRHRSGITKIKTLKNREYASRGIPFIYSEQDSDFDHQPYVLKAPADESAIDIRQIISFAQQCTMAPADIRATVEHLSWRRQMQRVVEEATRTSDK